MVERMVLAEQAQMEPLGEEAEEEEEEQTMEMSPVPCALRWLLPSLDHFCIDRNVPYLWTIKQNQAKPNRNILNRGGNRLPLVSSNNCCQEILCECLKI